MDAPALIVIGYLIVALAAAFAFVRRM